jgi:hypothetical protein
MAHGSDQRSFVILCAPGVEQTSSYMDLGKVHGMLSNTGSRNLCWNFQHAITHNLEVSHAHRAHFVTSNTEWRVNYSRKHSGNSSTMSPPEWPSFSATGPIYHTCAIAMTIPAKPHRLQKLRRTCESVQCNDTIVMRHS